MDVAKQDVFAFVNYSPPHSFPIEDGTTEILIRVEWWLKEYREAVRHAPGGRMKLAYRKRVQMFLRKITAPQWEWDWGWLGCDKGAFSPSRWEAIQLFLGCIEIGTWLACAWIKWLLKINQWNIGKCLIVFAPVSGLSLCSEGQKALGAASKPSSPGWGEAVPGCVSVSSPSTTQGMRPAENPPLKCFQFSWKENNVNRKSSGAGFITALPRCFRGSHHC